MYPYVQMNLKGCFKALEEGWLANTAIVNKLIQAKL